MEKEKAVKGGAGVVVDVGRRVCESEREEMNPLVLYAGHETGGSTPRPPARPPGRG